MLIDSSYFIGERNIPNTTYPEVSSMLDSLIAIREKEYLNKALGYELFKAFEAGLIQATPEQRMVDILLGKEFIGSNGALKLWKGLVSITTTNPWLSVSLSSANDLYFTVGVGSAPVNGDDTYVNTSLAGVTYRVVQRAYGPLEALEDDNSNVATADIQINPSGGFTWLNSITFGQGDKYAIQMISTDLDVSSYDVVPEPESPIADFVFYYYLRKQATQTAGIGQVSPKAENANVVSPVEDMCAAWNAMVEKTKVLAEFLNVNGSVYPEFQKHMYSAELEELITRLNPHF